MHFCTISWLTIRKWLRNLFSAKVNVLKWHLNHSQSPLFGFTVLYPHWKWNITFLVHVHLNMQMKNCIKCFFAILSVHCGDFTEKIKNLSYILWRHQHRLLIVRTFKSWSVDLNLFNFFSRILKCKSSVSIQWRALIGLSTKRAQKMGSVHGLNPLTLTISFHHLLQPSLQQKNYKQLS